MRFGAFRVALAATALMVAVVAALPASAQLRNPCPANWAGDGDCDEPNGLNLCDWGTDPQDCSNPNANYGSGPGFSAGVYAPATPIPTPAPTPVPAACPYTNDGDCDEPNGLNLCPWGTDAVDCSNPNSFYGSGPGYSAGIYAGNAPAPAPAPVPVPVPQPAPQPTQPAMTAISGGAFVHGGGGGYSGCPNYTIANTAFGQHTMYAGQGSYRVPYITAGGRFPLTNCFPGTGWRGYTITRPDFRFFYQGVSQTGRITFQLTSNAVDTVLLVNTPDGQWFFNDDSNGTFNSTLTFSPVLQGQYDIWAGAYNNSSNNPAELWIYE